MAAQSTDQQHAAEAVARAADSPRRAASRAGVLTARPVPTLASPAQVASLAGLRRRDAYTLGGFAGRQVENGDRLVPGVDLAGQYWWLPAAAVWADAELGEALTHPHPVGLAVDTDWDRAVLAGLSDRLGWEGVVVHDALGGLELVDPDAIDDPALLAELTELGVAAELTVHSALAVTGVPTVVITAPGVLRWGAGATWAAALRRALFGAVTIDTPGTPPSVELRRLAARLAGVEVDVVAVDIGTQTLQAAGITRCSVQLIVR